MRYSNSRRVARGIPAFSCLLLFISFLLTGVSLIAQDQRTFRSDWLEAVPSRKFLPMDTAFIMQVLRSGEKTKYLPTDSALRLLSTVYAKSQAIGYYDGMAGALIETGAIRNKLGNQEQALRIYSKAIWYSRRAFFYKHFAAAAYSNMGSIYLFMGKYEWAARYFDSALNEGILAHLPKDRNHLVITYNNLSVVYSKLGRPHLALQYLNIAENMARKNGFIKELKLTLCNKGNVYADLKQGDKAITCFEEALVLAKKTGDGEMLQAANNGLGVMMLQQNEPEQAIVYLKEAVRNNPTHDRYYGSIMPGYYLGMAYSQLGKYSLAEGYLLEAIHQAEQTGYFNDRLTAHKTLAGIYEATGRYREANQQLHIYEQQKDTLLNKEKIKDINELEIKYQTAQKDRQLMAKDRDILLAAAVNRRQNVFIGVAALIVFFLLIVLVVLRYFQKSRIKSMRQKQELAMFKAVLTGEEGERVRLGQELHDGVGGYLSAIKISLSSLRMKLDLLAEEKLFIQALDLADTANEELREIAHNLVPSSLVKNGLGAAVRLLCKRWNTGGSINILVQENGLPWRMNSAAELIIYRVIQELTHNIIKHSGAMQANLSLSWQNQLLLVAIEDDGKGLPEKEIKGEGIGLSNIRRRVDAVKGTIEIKSYPDGGTSVYMEFPGS